MKSYAECYEIIFTDFGKNSALAILTKIENTETYKCHGLV